MQDVNPYFMNAEPPTFDMLPLTAATHTRVIPAQIGQANCPGSEDCLCLYTLLSEVCQKLDN